MERENNYNAPALAYTLVIYGIILVLCYLTYISIPYTQTQIEQGGVEVNYGNTDQGMGDDFTSTEAPKASTKTRTRVANENAQNNPEEKSKSHSASKEILTQNNEEADEINSGKANPKKHKIENPNPAPPQPKPEKLNIAALYKGPSNSGSGDGDGNSHQPGNQGAPNGSVLSHSYIGTGGSGGTGSGGNGKGGGISLSLSGRKFVSRPSLEDDGQTEGKITVRISVDREGNIINAEAGGRGTTIQNEALWKKCENAVLRAKLNSTSSGPDAQNGLVVFSFKLL